MGHSRRDFIKKSAYLAALSATGVTSAKAQSSDFEERILDNEWMELCISHFYGLEKERMQLSRQMGVYGAVTSSSGDDLIETKKKFEEEDLQWKVLEGVNIHRAQLGIEGTDEDIENFIELMKNLSEAGINIISYNWRPILRWSRTDYERYGRGNSLITAFDIEDADKSLTEYGEFSKETMWDNLEYFLNAVVPEAEKYGIKLAMHPDDPPINEMRGISRILGSVDDFKRLIEIYPSPNNGINFCQGTFATMGEDVPAAIRYFGERNRINYVHFRDIRGNKNNFEETWHDEGMTDMYECMKAYYEVGYRGPIRPDHVPTIAGYEEHENPSYMDLGLLFAIGYMRGLMESVVKNIG